MKDLALRLAALDPDASAALQVIAHFDQLTSARAGLPTIVREAARLADCPARLSDDERRVSVRVEPDGTARPPAGPAAPDWPSEPLPGENAARLWLERPGPATGVQAMVLERAAAAAATVLCRTRSGSARPLADDPAYVDLVLDPTVPTPDRLRAARHLGLAPTAYARAVAVPGPAPDGPVAYVEPAGSSAPTPYRVTGRAGLGRAVPVEDLPSSWADARTALRFTAEGTAADPGPRVVAYPDLGGLTLLAAAVGPGTEPVPDVLALAELAATTHWALATLTAVTQTGSLRAAAAELRIHHSTLQDRLVAIEHQLGWSVRDPGGRLRLQVALTLRRLHRNPR